MLLRLSVLLAALSLATAIAISIATPLHSEPGREVEEVRYSEPAAVERPIASAKAPQNSRPPNIRPESAVAPEIRVLEQKEIRQQEAARQKLEQQELRQQKAEQRKLQQQKVAQLRAEQQKAEQQKAAQQEDEQREAAQRKAKQREVERRRAEEQRAEQRKAQAEREKTESSSAVRTVLPLLPQPAEVVGGERAKSDRPTRTGSRSRVVPPAPRGGRMALSINSIGLRNGEIETTEDQQALDRGLIHLPQTPRPWERGEPRNVYVVGHRVG